MSKPHGLLDPCRNCGAQRWTTTVLDLMLNPDTLLCGGCGVRISRRLLDGTQTKQEGVPWNERAN